MREWYRVMPTLKAEIVLNLLRSNLCPEIPMKTVGVQHGKRCQSATGPRPPDFVASKTEAETALFLDVKTDSD